MQWEARLEIFLLFALGCAGDKTGGDDTGAVDTATSDGAATDDTAASDDTAGGGSPGGDSDTDDTADTEDTAAPPRDCVDYRAAYADCTGTWATTSSDGGGPRGVDTFDASGDLVRSEVDNDGDGLLDATIAQGWDSDGRLLEQRTFLHVEGVKDADPFTEVVYTWLGDGRPDTYRYLRNNGSDVNILYTYVYDEEDVLERFIIDARDDGDSERECAIFWSSSDEGVEEALWECFGEGTETRQLQVFDSTGLVPINRYDDFDSDAWNREVYSTFADDCRVTYRETHQDPKLYSSDVHDLIERTYSYDAEGRWTGDTTVNIETDGSRPDFTIDWERVFACPGSPNSLLRR